DEERRLLYVAMTRPKRRLHLYVPVRYYHRPRGIDDAHGYGQPSRFLTAEVKRLCEVVRPPEPRLDIAGMTGETRRVEVSVDGLFE
ncbi:MAG TPA: hypothetical protein VGL78_12920, partial [Solirubrobacteraceae bacterium]